MTTAHATSTLPPRRRRSRNHAARAALLAAATIGAQHASAQTLPVSLQLTPNDAAAGDRFGSALGLSGTTAIVGAYLNDDTGTDSGSAYLFDTTTQQQLHKLIASDGAAFDRFGFSVAVSGTLAIVGADSDGDNGFRSGSAYLFDTSSGLQRAKLTADEGAAEDRFGWSVGVSGTTAIVGTPNDDGPGSNRGAAYLFDAVTGDQLHKLIASDPGLSDNLGYAVAISGTTAIAGSIGDDDRGPNAGAVYVFDTTTGSELRKLTADDGAASDNLGTAVAISGTTAIAGAPFNNSAGDDAGAAYLFDTSTGQQLFKLTASDGAAGDRFGASVAISGTTAIVGAFRDANSGADTGAAYLFDTTTGQQIAKLVAAGGMANDRLGWAVAASGTTALLGSLFGGDAGFAAGEVHLFAQTPGALAQPSSTIVDEGDTASFEILLADPAGVTFQWRRDGAPLTDGGNISGATTPTLEIVAGDGDRAFYDCVYTRLGTPQISDQALLAVRPAPNPCVADLNEDGLLDLTDINIFVIEFTGGCP